MFQLEKDDAPNWLIWEVLSESTICKAKCRISGKH